MQCRNCEQWEHNTDLPFIVGYCQDCWAFELDPDQKRQAKDAAAEALGKSCPRCRSARVWRFCGNCGFEPASAARRWWLLWLA
jgi:hypothetical protein